MFLSLFNKMKENKKTPLQGINFVHVSFKNRINMHKFGSNLSFNLLGVQFWLSDSGGPPTKSGARSSGGPGSRGQRPKGPKAQSHQVVSGSLALLYFLLGFHGGRQGRAPNRRQSPVEWGDFPYAH